MPEERIRQIQAVRHSSKPGHETLQESKSLLVIDWARDHQWGRGQNKPLPRGVTLTGWPLVRAEESKKVLPAGAAKTSATGFRLVSPELAPRGLRSATRVPCVRDDIRAPPQEDCGSE